MTPNSSPIRGSASTAHSVPVTDSNADCRDEFECREDDGEHAESEHEASEGEGNEQGMGSLAARLQASNNAIIASCTSTSNLAPKTVSAYEKSLKSYTKFMAETWPGACVRPIDPDMVLNFLSSESKRPARRSGTGVDQGEDIEGTTIGVSVLKNHLNALEHPRDFPPIGNLEAGWKKREAGRKKSAQTNKIEGTASDNVTKEEQLQISEHLLCQGPTALERPDHPPIKTLYIVADSGKTNKEGRLDYKPVARHFDPRICNVGAVAFYMWFRDEYTGGLPYAHLAATHSCIRSPTRVSRHSWCLIGGRLARLAEIGHNVAVSTFLKECDVHSSHTTHLSRIAGAQMSAERGANEADTKALGGWSDGTFRSVYQRGDPTTSFIALAGFNGKFPERYYVARDIEADVPDDLQRLIFPWVEAALAEFEERFEADELCQDKALVGHLKLLQWFRLVILQDAAFLIQAFPDAPIFQASLFQSDRFRTWAPHFVASVEGNGREEAALKVVYGGLLDSIVDRLGAQQSSERQSATAHLRSDNRRILELLIEQHNRGGHFHGHVRKRRRHEFVRDFDDDDDNSDDDRRDLSDAHMSAPTTVPPAAAGNRSDRMRVGQSLAYRLPSHHATMDALLRPPAGDQLEDVGHLLAEYRRVKERNPMYVDPRLEALGLDDLARFPGTLVEWSTTITPPGWLPVVKFNPATNVEDVYLLYETGVAKDGDRRNPSMPWREMERRFGTRWRGAPGQTAPGVEWTRINRVLKFINEAVEGVPSRHGTLQQRSELVVASIKTALAPADFARYRKFYEHMQKKDTREVNGAQLNNYDALKLAVRVQYQ
ncbi:BZ3501_MvSof-1269-A2-R1_Chr12-3g03580 [Microbotryum saponariae]|nr:BZ3501_MvSof-1269-A2-R1_Chr12-3g03580 [Microbotryum saponariae]